MLTAEDVRLQESHSRTGNWHRWGPYLSERQWGTVREDYSEYGEAWSYFPHEHARSRAYRWGEDGLLGICDRQCRLCFSVALWNGRDSILKERLYGLTGPEGNHGEDVKEEYFYLDSTPTHSYLKGLYKYPQAEFPYTLLQDENRRRGKHDPEFELVDTGVFDENRYFDVQAEYAKAGEEDILIRLTVTNRGPEEATVDVLPTLWFRNTWSWGCTHEGCERKPRLWKLPDGSIQTDHVSLGRHRFFVESGSNGDSPELLFTENETNMARLFGLDDGGPAKDAFHDYMVHGQKDAVCAKPVGTKVAVRHTLTLAPGEDAVLRLRLVAEKQAPKQPFGASFDETFAQRVTEADEFYACRIPADTPDEERKIARQAYAGLLWSKQFYHYAVQYWLDGDPAQPVPPAARKHGRNSDWPQLFNRDILSMPDKWEYPWYAAWDLAFHMIPMAVVDPEFAKSQLLLLLREWYMHPNGQIPAYEWAFSDVNPPVHAWACWRVYKMTGPRGGRDRDFLARAFQKLLINFTWWVNRKDVHGKHLFAGGFLGLDNIGVFDRSRPLPGGGHLEQADGTAWMAFYCATMLSMALELARYDSTYEDVASKFFEHFVAIADAMNCLGGTGLWDDEDGFYYDQLQLDGQLHRLKIRSMVGVIPLFAVEVLEQDHLEQLPGFRRRMEWFLQHRGDLARDISYLEKPRDDGTVDMHRLLAIPARDRLEHALVYLLDENEFLSEYGIRALSRVHKDKPYVFWAGEEHRVDYVPGESTVNLFGGNSNWRGPIWFPVNYLLIEALERYHHFYGDDFRVQCPTGSGKWMTLSEVAEELSRRLRNLFLPDAAGRRACHGDDARYQDDPHYRDLVLFYEYFHGDTGRGIGANHQTGWTALIARMLSHDDDPTHCTAANTAIDRPTQVMSGVERNR